MYWTIKKIFGKFFSSLFKLEIKGKENFPSTGKIIICSNHLSNWDPILEVAAFDRQIHFMAKKQLFSIPVLKGFLKKMGMFPVNRGTADPLSLKTAISYLENDETVGIFPQGTRHRGVPPEGTEVKGGVGMIAYRSKSDVLPVFIKTKGNKIIPFRKVELIVGKVINNSELKIEKPALNEYNLAAEFIFNRILSLKGE